MSTLLIKPIHLVQSIDLSNRSAKITAATTTKKAYHDNDGEMMKFILRKQYRKDKTNKNTI